MKNEISRYISLPILMLGFGLTLTAGADISKPQASQAKPSLSNPKVAQIPPKIGFNHVAHSPSPTNVGAHLTVSAAVENKGTVPTGPNFKFQMTCHVMSGSVCPIASNASPIAIPDLPVGNQKSFTFVSTSAAQAGKYKLRFRIFDGAMQAVATSEINIAVGN